LKVQCWTKWLGIHFKNCPTLQFNFEIMNQARRKELEKAREIIDIVKIEEEEAYENLPESLQCSEKGDAIEENIGALDEAIEQIDQAINN